MEGMLNIILGEDSDDDQTRARTDYINALKKSPRVCYDPAKESDSSKELREAVGLPPLPHFIIEGGLQDSSETPGNQPSDSCGWAIIDECYGPAIEWQLDDTEFCLEWFEYLLETFFIPWGWTFSEEDELTLDDQPVVVNGIEISVDGEVRPRSERKHDRVEDDLMIKSATFGIKHAAEDEAGSAAKKSRDEEDDQDAA